MLKQYTELKLLEQFLTTFNTEVLDKLRDESVQTSLMEAKIHVKTSELSRVMTMLPDLTTVFPTENLQVDQQ